MTQKRRFIKIIERAKTEDYNLEINDIETIAKEMLPDTTLIELLTLLKEQDGKTATEGRMDYIADLAEEIRTVVNTFCKPFLTEDCHDCQYATVDHELTFKDRVESIYCQKKRGYVRKDEAKKCYMEEPDLIIDGEVGIIRQEKKYPIDEKTGLVDYKNFYYEVEIEVKGEILNFGED